MGMNDVNEGKDYVAGAELDLGTLKGKKVLWH